MFQAWTDPWDIEEWLNAAALMNDTWIANHGTSGLEQRWRMKSHRGRLKTAGFRYVRNNEGRVK
jgi:uncharacterized protein YndB with AHSA1/START domain